MHKKIDEFIKNPRKALLKLAFPIVIAMMVQTLYNVVDTAYVGRLGNNAIAALTFSFPLYFILISINAGLGIGMGQRISRFLGAKEKKAAENVAMHGLLVSVILSIIIIVLGIIFLKPVLYSFGAEQEVLKLSIDYMSIILYGVIFMFPVYIISSIFSAQGDTKMQMKIQLTGLILNFILEPIFIYGFHLGVKGSAIATVISIFVTFIMSLYYLKKYSYLKIEPKVFRFRSYIVKEIFTVGIPATLMMLLVSIYVIFLNKFMDKFGVDYVASFGIVSRLESVATMPVFAFSMAAVTLVGMFYGAKRYDLIKDISKYAIKIGLMITSTVGIIFFAFPHLFLKIFTTDANLIAIAVPYLRLDVFTFPLMTTGIMIGRIMQGMGSGMPGLWINVIRIFVVAVPLAALFVYVFGYGYLSIAIAMILGGFVSSVVGVFWLRAKITRLGARQ